MGFMKWIGVNMQEYEFKTGELVGDISEVSLEIPRYEIKKANIT